MIKFDDITNQIGNVVNAGISGSSIQPRSFTQSSTVIAQFPAERSSATDSSSAIAVNNLYQNGLMFTAYNYTPRTSTSLKDFRTSKSAIGRAFEGAFGGLQHTIARDAVATILMPRSQTDVDAVSHRFNDVGDSVMTRGGGSFSGAISNMASHALFGAVESIVSGYMADHGEQIQTASRSMYGGPDNRTKTYMWTLTPRTVYDLVEIIKIYEIFTYLSYGKTGQSSSHTKELKGALDSWYKETILNPSTPTETYGDATLFEGVTEFLTNVLVVSNPTIWMIDNFGSNNGLEARSAAFGPCQIQSIRFDKSPNGHFGGLAVAPNLPNAFVLEVTFNEIIALNRDVLFSNSVGGL